MSKGTYGLAYNKLSEIDALLASAIANADYFLVDDVSVDKPKKVLASGIAIQKGATSQVVYNAKVTATQAEINADKVLLAGETGVTIRPIRVIASVAGTFLTGTAVVLSDTSETIEILSLATAQLTTGAKIDDGDTGATRGAGLAGDLTAGEGITVVNTGTAFEGGTSITFDIQYTKTV